MNRAFHRHNALFAPCPLALAGVEADRQSENRGVHHNRRPDTADYTGVHRATECVPCVRETVHSVAQYTKSDFDGVLTRFF